MANLISRILVQNFIASVLAQRLTADIKTDISNEYRLVNDVFLTSDQTQFVLTKELIQELFETTDLIAHDFSKVEMDSVAFTDAFVTEFTKVFDSSYLISDGHAFLIGKTLEDSLVNYEDVSFDLQKLIETVVPMNDFSVAGDKYIYAINKSIFDFTILTDKPALNAGKVSTDNLLLDEQIIFIISNATNIKKIYTFPFDTLLTFDSGFIAKQNYCDPLYFADNYVGETFIFN